MLGKVFTTESPEIAYQQMGDDVELTKVYTLKPEFAEYPLYQLLECSLYNEQRVNILTQLDYLKQISSIFYAPQKLDELSGDYVKIIAGYYGSIGILNYSRELFMTAYDFNGNSVALLVDKTKLKEFNKKFSK